jgi:hypothetical protein
MESHERDKKLIDDELADLLIQSTLDEFKEILFNPNNQYAGTTDFISELKSTHSNMDKFIKIEKMINNAIKNSEEAELDTPQILIDLQKKCQRLYEYEEIPPIIGSYKKAHETVETKDEKRKTVSIKPSVSDSPMNYIQLIDKMLEATNNYIKYITEEKIEPYAPKSLRSTFFAKSSKKKFDSYTEEKNHLLDFARLLGTLKASMMSKKVEDFKALEHKYNLWYGKFEERINKSGDSKKAQFAAVMKSGIDTLKDSYKISLNDEKKRTIINKNG